MSFVIRNKIRAGQHIAQKKAIYERYKEGFKYLPVMMNPYDKGNSEPNFWLSCLLIDADVIQKVNPMKILNTLAKYNAEGRPIWKPMHMQPIFKGNPFITREGIGGSSDIGADIFNRGLCLPSDNKMTVEEQNIIIQMIRSCFE